MKDQIRNLEIDEDSTIYLTGEINQMSAFIVTLQLYDLSKKLDDDEPIYIIIDSGGGAVFAAFDIIKAMESIPQPVYTVAKYAYSAAFMIFQHGIERLILRYGFIGQHQASLGMGNDELKKHKSFLDFIIRVELLEDRYQAWRMGMTLEAFLQMVDNQSYFIDEDAVKANAADEVVLITVISGEIVPIVYEGER